ncbi:MAG: CZB domain-containing protein [Terriglobales bacterium]
MDFDQAIAVHSEWKRKLSRYLQKPDGSLKSADIALDNKCDLGKWIAIEGVKFSTLKEFNSLKAEHSRFHKAAAKIVVRADHGEKVTEEMALSSNSEFGNASTAVVQAIMHIKSAISH